MVTVRASEDQEGVPDVGHYAVYPIGFEFCFNLNAIVPSTLFLQQKSLYIFWVL